MEIKKIDFSQIKKGLMEELFYGSIAGVVVSLVGHPFDTIKTRMQVTNQSLKSTVINLVEKEGIRAFYKGLSSPLCTLPVINAIVFGSYATSKKMLEVNNHILQFSSNQIILFSSITAGFLNSFVAGPMELFKTKMQLQMLDKYYKSNIDLMQKLIKVSGFKGLFQGTYVTIMRELIGYPCQFLTYEFMLNYFRKRQQKSNISSFYYMISGACAGVSCWTSSYLFDIIKTRVQSQVLKRPLRIFPNGNFLREFHFIYSNYGIRGYFVGLGAIMGRASLANACGFWAWEFSKYLFQTPF
jgi:solute carrier family 25 carnitine/acylcarnitine transporter 20/29